MRATAADAAACSVETQQPDISGSLMTSRPPGFSDAQHLGDRGLRIGHVDQHPVHPYGIQTIVGKRELISRSLHEFEIRQFAVAASRFGDHRFAQIDADHRAGGNDPGKTGRILTGSAADLDHPGARPGAQGFETLALVDSERIERMHLVEPFDEILRIGLVYPGESPQFACVALHRHKFTPLPLRQIAALPTPNLP